LTAAQPAKRFSVSQSWVYKAAEDDRLPYRRLGGEDGPLRVAVPAAAKTVTRMPSPIVPKVFWDCR
jgi:hypothetical protein